MPSCTQEYRSFLAKTSKSSWPVSWRSSAYRTDISSRRLQGANSSSVSAVSTLGLRSFSTDATGTARPFVNGKGKRRRPGTKSLASVLKSDDDLFLDFISKCLTWDPDKRLKPQPAMRHPWILAGRRRMTSAGNHNRDERGSNRLDSPAHATRSSTRTLSEITNGGKDREKGKQLLISPPTPLMARQGTASKITNSISSTRLPSSTQLRNSTMMVSSSP